MQEQIKVGSRVVFRGEQPGTAWTLDDLNGFPDDRDEVGNAGTVESKTGGILRVRMDSGYVLDEWDLRRYELVPERVQFQAGDIVTPNDTCTSQDTFTIGLEYVVTRVAGNTIYLESDDDGNTRRFRQSGEFDLVRRPSEQPAAVFLIAGMTTEYPTQETAERFLAEDGDNGKEYTITQVVRRVRVNRTANLETI